MVCGYMFNLTVRLEINRLFLPKLVFSFLAFLVQLVFLSVYLFITRVYSQCFIFGDRNAT